MEKKILKFKGLNNNHDKLFQDKEGRCYSYNEHEGLAILAGDFDSDAIALVENMDSLKDVKFILTGHENEPTEEDKNNYMLLSRLKGDCDYFLGNGNRHKKYLWEEDIEKHIGKMKEIYNSFTHDKKPEWLTMSDIEEYEKLMS